jgi:SAM-dependent methyltransferase
MDRRPMKHPVAPPANPTVGGRNRVIFKSKPLTGIMSEEYFDLANAHHFWCRRRFDVLQKLAGEKLRGAGSVAEIGCGNGVLQQQFEDAYGVAPDGFDLHEQALSHSVARSGKVYCYDIHDRAPEFCGAFDLLLMFDVLEHIQDEDSFLASAAYHLAKGGTVILNVPALPWLFSGYDTVQGHQRRYSLKMIRAVAKKNGFRIRGLTYWGSPLVPILALRTAILAVAKPGLNRYSTGFDPRNDFLNTCLYHLSRLELVSQLVVGTSIMAVLEVDD